MFRLNRRRPRTEWRPERGPGYDLRQYSNGRPTGLVAAIAWHEHGAAVATVQEISGPDVTLIVTRSRVTVVERCASGQRGARLLVPLRSCVDAQILDEPRLPGAELVRLNLTVRIGQDVTLTLPMWFPGEQRPQLHRFVRRVQDRAGTSAAPRPTPQLPVIDVERAPDTDDWVVFRPHRTSAEVLRSLPAREFVTRSIEEAR